MPCTWSPSCAQLHIQCAEKLLSAEHRNEVGGHSFYAADFHSDHQKFHDDIQASLEKASQGRWKARGHDLMPRPLVHAIGFVANLVDWYYKGNVRHQVFQLAHLPQIGAYALGDLTVSTQRARTLLDFEPVSATEAFRQTAEYYVNT